MYGKQYEIVVENNAKVIDIKQEVYNQSTISPEDQKLMRSFRQLNDEDSIANYSLKDGGKNDNALFCRMTQIASDSLVLFKVRTPSPLVVEETTPAPTKQMIMEATGAKGTTQFETFSNCLVKSNHDSKSNQFLKSLL